MFYLKKKPFPHGRTKTVLKKINVDLVDNFWPPCLLNKGVHWHLVLFFWIFLLTFRIQNTRLIFFLYPVVIISSISLFWIIIYLWIWNYVNSKQWRLHHTRLTVLALLAFHSFLLRKNTGIKWLWVLKIWII